jgi:thiol-disulfide isomerase/thioredoxin
MSGRKALLVAVLIAAVSVTWAASRYARQLNGHAAAAEAPDAAERMTLHFYRNPSSAPALETRDIDGRDVSLAALPGKVVLINFWATWCGPCRAEIPDLVKLQEKYRDGLQIIGISQDEAPVDVVRRFAAEHHVNYPVVMSTPEIEKLFPGISALPTSFIIDRESRVVQKHVGMLTASLTETETRALAGLPVNASIEEVDQTQGLKLENGAQAIDIPGIDLSKLDAARRTEALQKLNAQPCTCGCDLTVARCRVDDPSCGVSLPLARDIVKQIAANHQ